MLFLLYIAMLLISTHAERFNGSFEILDYRASVVAVAITLVEDSHLHFIGTDYVDMDQGGKVNTFIEEFNWRTETGRNLTQKKGQPGCSSAGFLPDGKLIVTGGVTPTLGEYIKTYKYGETANYNETEFAMTTFRWYASVVTMPDGQLVILGGSIKNNVVPRFNNPTFEFYPPRGPPRFLKFLDDHKYCDYVKENCALYPPIFLLPNGHYMVIADIFAIIWDPIKNLVIKKLPNIPANHYTYPYTGLVVLLPQSPLNKYIPTVLVCGGNPSSAGVPDVNRPTSNLCYRINPLSPNPIWIKDDPLPINSTMHISLWLADGTLLVHGGSNVGTYQKGELFNVGDIAAGSALLNPMIYNPDLPSGSRWKLLPPSKIPRVYHSSGLLLPDARVIFAGSQPNQIADSKAFPYPSEHRLEIFTPPYLPPTADSKRPAFTISSKTLIYGQAYTISLIPPFLAKRVDKLAILHQGFSTHSMQFNARFVYLDFAVVGNNTIKFRAPPSGRVLPVGSMYYIYLVSVAGRPSEGVKVAIGGKFLPVLDGLVANAPGTVDGSDNLGSKSGGFGLRGSGFVLGFITFLIFFLI